MRVDRFYNTPYQRTKGRGSRDIGKPINQLVLGLGTSKEDFWKHRANSKNDPFARMADVGFHPGAVEIVGKARA